MSKQAFLFLVHGDEKIFKQNIDFLSEYDNYLDIYVHVDSKTDITAYIDCTKSYKNIFFTDFRENVRWGDYSIVQAEILLLKKVVETGIDYSKIHLLSGNDLIIKPVPKILDFFDNKYEYVHFWDLELQKKPKFVNRYKYYNVTSIKNRKKIEKIKYHIKRNISIGIQKIFLVNRFNKDDIEIKIGSQWFSITLDFAKLIVSKEKWIEKKYSKTLCPDESFIQTIIYNEPLFYDKLYCKEENNDYNNIKRLIKFIDGKPKDWKYEDFKEIENSESFFCRKVLSKNFTNEFQNKIKESIHGGE